MKNFLLLTLTLFVYQVSAQETDSTSVETTPDLLEEEGSPQTPTAVDAVQDTTSGSSSPRIIYYQTTAEERRRERRDDIHTLSGNMNHSGGFGALSFRSTQFNGEPMVFAGVRGGWIINRTLGIGLEAHGIIPTAKYEGIHPTNDVVALGGYGGMFLELIFFSNEVVHVTFPVSGGAGWIGYNIDYDEDNLPMPGSDLVDDDIFWYLEPGANLEVNLSRNFRLAFGASKRFVQDLELQDTRPGALGNINYYVTLKVGGF